MPIGPVGKPTELHLCFPMLAFTYTKYPQACKAFMAFMLEAEQLQPVGRRRGATCRTRSTPTTTTRSGRPIPKRTVFRDVGQAHADAGGLGSVGEKAAAAIADFIVVDMFANVCTGREDAKGAIAIAERQVKRIYR